jgi:hypothetical protein
LISKLPIFESSRNANLCDLKLLDPRLRGDPLEGAREALRFKAADATGSFESVRREEVCALYFVSCAQSAVDPGLRRGDVVGYWFAASLKAFSSSGAKA